MRREKIGVFLDKYDRWIFFAVTFMAAIVYLLLYFQMRDLAHSTAANTAAIQESRQEYLLWECNDVNNRNKGSKLLLEQYQFSPETKEFVELFIDSSIPFRDCELLVQEFAPTNPQDNRKKGG